MLVGRPDNVSTSYKTSGFKQLMAGTYVEICKLFILSLVFSLQDLALPSSLSLHPVADVDSRSTVVIS